MKCKECGVVLESKFEYDRHLSFHQDLSNRCNVCDKGFKHKKALDRHKLIHSSTKSYVCTGCDKTFSRKDHMRRHKFRVHKITETPANVFEEAEEEPDEAVVDEPMVEEPEPVILSLPSAKDSQNPHFVGSIHQLYNSEDITDILKDISSNDINQVIKKMEPRQIKTLRSILSSDSSAEAKVPDNNRPIGKKSLLKRYRNQSGVEVDSVDVGGKFPKMNLSSGQREAAALARRADVNWHREDGWTPLHWAGQEGHEMAIDGNDEEKSQDSKDSEHHSVEVAPA